MSGTWQDRKIWCKHCERFIRAGDARITSTSEEHKFVKMKMACPYCHFRIKGVAYRKH